MTVILSGLVTAFSMYSVLPMPQVPWDGRNLRYVLCFLPLVGLLPAGAGALWLWFCGSWNVVPGLFAAVAAVIPAALTGGIHMDGLMDTADALFSRAPRQRRLEILADSRTGAFAVLYCAGYLLLSFGLWQQVYRTPVLCPLVLGGYIASRCCGALSVALLPCAKESGLGRTFSDSARKPAVAAVNLSVLLALFAAALFWSWLWALLALLVFFSVCCLHRGMCRRLFGGSTGDLAGWLIQHLELCALILSACGLFLGEV